MHCRKLVCLERLAYSAKSLIFDELKERKGVEDRKEKIELIWTKRRQLIILGHGKWLDEKTEQSANNLKCRVKIIIIILMIFL